MRTYNNWTDKDIINYIKCDKTMKSTPPGEKLKNRNYDRRFSVFSKDNAEFQVFVTQASRMLKDFSIGLIYEDCLLFRCNGFHGPTKAGTHRYDHHVAAHTHTLTANDISSGRERRPSQINIVSGAYADKNSCIYYFMKECNVTNFGEFMPELAQLSLFEGDAIELE